MLAWLLACAPPPDDSGYGFAVGPDMYPGDNCRSCHKEDGPYPEAPVWTVAGTVFTDASGAAGAAGVVVRVTDDVGSVVEVTTTASGNFYTGAEVVPPYLVELATGGASVPMPASPPSGGCNACHAATPVGGAPGALFVGEFASTLECDGGSTLTTAEGTGYPCDPYVCEGAACRFDCEGDEHCVDGTTCLEGRCR